MQIVRKDGIVYERKRKKVNYDKKITFTINTDLKNKIDKLNIKQGEFIRKAIENELKKY